MAISISSQFTQKFYFWTNWKAVQLIKFGIHQYDDDGSIYTIYFYDGPEIHYCNIYKGEVPESIASSYSQEQNDADKLDFESNFQSISNQSIVKRDTKGRHISVDEPRVGDETIYTTHNFCDKVSWFSDSERITNKTLTSGDGFIWESGDPYWVDMISGRVQDDDGLVAEQAIFEPENPHGYQVIVTVDGYVKDMREPLETNGGDYEVYWDDGYIKSFDDWTGKEVLASYSKVSGSTFILRPLPGKILNIEAAEADFSIDCIMLDNIEYNVFGYAGVFAPDLGLPPDTKIPLSLQKYKRLSQILNEAIGSYPKLEVYGSDEETRSLSDSDFRRTARGLKSIVQSIPFRYATIRSLQSSYGLELRIKLSHDRQFTGSLATLTFYCTSVSE